MTLKERKALIEQNIQYGLSKSVGENVNVGVNYLLDSGLVVVSLVEQHLNNEAHNLEAIVNYGIRYDENTDLLSVYALSRRYHYDNLSVTAVTTEPIYVDEGFIASIKELIKFGMDENFNAAAFDPQPVEEALEAEIVEE